MNAVARPLTTPRLLALLLVLAPVPACESSSSDQCRGPGRYQAGKAGSYRPCCAGLTEVFYLSPATSDTGPVCTQLPLRVYACVRGSCGDGICEADEAPSCGCVADCPDAAWGPGGGGDGGR